MDATEGKAITERARPRVLRLIVPPAPTGRGTAERPRRQSPHGCRVADDSCKYVEERF
jgi:hypothetical protein